MIRTQAPFTILVFFYFKTSKLFLTGNVGPAYLGKLFFRKPDFGCGHVKKGLRNPRAASLFWKKERKCATNHTI